MARVSFCPAMFVRLEGVLTTRCLCARHSECCRPVVAELQHAAFTRGSFIEDTVVELERSHPDTIACMLLVAHTVLPVNGDGIGISKASGKVRPTATLHRPCWMR